MSFRVSHLTIHALPNLYGAHLRNRGDNPEAFPILVPLGGRASGPVFIPLHRSRIVAPEQRACFHWSS
jgi:hypothetical protein